MGGGVSSSCGEKLFMCGGFVSQEYGDRLARRGGVVSPEFCESLLGAVILFQESVVKVC